MTLLNWNSDHRGGEPTVTKGVNQPLRRGELSVTIESPKTARLTRPDKGAQTFTKNPHVLHVFIAIELRSRTTGVYPQWGTQGGKPCSQRAAQRQAGGRGAGPGIPPVGINQENGGAIYDSEL